MTAAFISATSGVPDRDVTVPAGADIMVVAVLGNVEQARSGATFDGNALSVATNANLYTAVFYQLAPEVDAVGPLNITPSTEVGNMIVAFYSTTTSGFTFQSGQQASTGSASYSPTGAALIAHGIACTNTTGTITPVASTTERFDINNGNWYGDRIVTGSGAVTVGASNATDPDYGGAIFLEASTSIDVSGSATFPALSAAGVAYQPNISGAVAFPALTAAGSVEETTVSGSATFPSLGASGVAYQPDVLGAVIFPTLSASGAAAEEGAASGAVVFPALLAAGVVYAPGISAAVSFPAFLASGTIDVPVVLGPPGGSASVTVPTGIASVSVPGGSAGASFAAGTATVTVPRGTASARVQ